MAIDVEIVLESACDRETGLRVELTKSKTFETFTIRLFEIEDRVQAERLFREIEALMQKEG